MHNQSRFVPMHEAEAELGAMHADTSTDLIDERTAQAIEAFTSMLSLMRPGRSISVKAQATTLLAVLWAVNPALIGGRSLIDIERETNGVISRYQLSKAATRFTRSIGFRSSGQRPRSPTPLPR